jgi:hypothetical protein
METIHNNKDFHKNVGINKTGILINSCRCDFENYFYSSVVRDCLCGLVVKVPDYRFRFDSRRYQIFSEK